MYLEDIVAQYGITDYYDRVNGFIFELSKAKEYGKYTLLVPVRETCTGDLVGYRTIAKVGD